MFIWGTADYTFLFDTGICLNGNEHTILISGNWLGKIYLNPVLEHRHARQPVSGAADSRSGGEKGF
jgi:hypothetical protein